MKKTRGFRLGKRLAIIWNSCWRPAKHRRYLRLASDEPCRSLRRAQNTETRAVAERIVRWGRCLSQRLRRLQKMAEEELLHRRNVYKTPPKGHLAVYVGRQGVDPLLYRVVVPVIFFNHPLFGELLCRAQDEFGFDRSGGIVIPCPISDFELVRRRVAAAAGVQCRHSGKAEPWAWEF